jgi:hypothetical protein
MNSDSSKVTSIVKNIIDLALGGAGPLASAPELAEQYRRDDSYASEDERIDALIRWETTKNFGTGFLTGLGGLATLPLAVPASMVGAWVVQARMIGAIASIRGYDTTDDRVQTAILLCMLGDSGKEVLKRVGITVGEKVSISAISRIPGKVLVQINKLVGVRLLTKAGSKGIINLTKLVPLVGGFISGGFDAVATYTVGRGAAVAFA